MHVKPSTRCQKVDDTVGKLEDLQQLLPRHYNGSLVKFQMIGPLCSSQQHMDTFPNVSVTFQPPTVAYSPVNHDVAVVQRLGTVTPVVAEQDVGEQLSNGLEQMGQGRHVEYQLVQADTDLDGVGGGLNG